MSRSTSSRAPSSVANLGCLFDSAGMAIEAFHDEVYAVESSGGLEVDVTVGNVPKGEQNVAYWAARYLLKKVYGRETGLRIVVKKGVPISAGLGSSGATAAATVAAVNELLGIGASVGDLLEAAGAGEAAAAGSPHYDNAAASLLGGVVLADPRNPRTLITFEPPSWLTVILFFKQSSEHSKTRIMRSVLPRSVDLSELSCTSFAAAALAVGLTKGVKRYLSFASEGGSIETTRARYIPGYWEAKAAALRAGAIAFNISGAGPSLFALAEEDLVETIVESVIKLVPGFKPVVTKISSRGALHNVESRR